MKTDGSHSFKRAVFLLLASLQEEKTRLHRLQVFLRYCPDVPSAIRPDMKQQHLPQPDPVDVTVKQLQL